ncbi:hypothetical protein Xph01_13810 [Micromonospora phaseoli]|nr:hypothetical protein Xph01_13810 [Micromonospora phaseoli]
MVVAANAGVAEAATAVMVATVATTAAAAAAVTRFRAAEDDGTDTGRSPYLGGVVVVCRGVPVLAGSDARLSAEDPAEIGQAVQGEPVL